MNNKFRKDLYIKILEYANKHTKFIYPKLFEDLNFNQEEKNIFCQKLINSPLLLQNTGRTQKTESGHENIYTISIEGKFKLLDYQQLQQTRILALCAICIAAMSLLITLI